MHLQCKNKTKFCFENETLGTSIKDRYLHWGSDTLVKSLFRNEFLDYNFWISPNGT